MPRICKRDERGWKIPGNGTIARIVYDVMVAEAQSGEKNSFARLAGFLGTTHESLRVMATRIRNPGARSGMRRADFTDRSLVAEAQDHS